MIGLLLLQMATGRIVGSVTNEAGTPIAGAIVRVPMLDRRIPTDPRGRFLLEQLPEGSFAVVVEARDHRPATLRVSLSANATVRLDVGLAAEVAEPVRPSLRIEVRDERGELLNLATVEVDGVARTAVDGAATFRDLPVGTRRVRARRLGYEARDTTVALGPPEPRLVITLAPEAVELAAIRVVAASPSGSRAAADSSGFARLVTTGVNRILREDLDRVTPTFEPDVLRALQTTTGVGAANDLNAHLVIRGGGPEHTRFLLDGAPVLGPYHVFGVFGAFNPDAVGEAEVLRGALPARIGGVAGSVVSLRSLRSDSLRVTGGVTLLASRIAASGPLGAGGSWVVSGRRTNLSWAGSGLSIGNPYTFWDLQASATAPIGRRHSVSLSTFGSGDRFENDLFFVDERSDQLTARWSNRVASASWRWMIGKGWTTETATSWSEYRNQLQTGDSAFRAGSEPDRGQARLAALAVSVGRRSNASRFRIGLSLDAERTAIGGDTSFRSYVRDRIDRRATEFALSAEWERRLGAVTFAPGVRVGYRDAQDLYSVEPRVALRWQSSPKLLVTVAAAATSQGFQALRDDRFPLLGVPFYFLPARFDRPTRAVSTDATVSFEPSPTWRFEASWYRRRLRGLPRWRPADERTLADIRYDNGSATGLELMAAKRTGRVTGWVSYTPMDAHMEPDGEPAYRPLWGRRHAVDLVAQTVVGGAWRLSTRMTWTSGQPFWAERGSIPGWGFSPGRGGLDLKDQYPVWSEQQATLPTYFRTDVVLTGRFRLAGLEIRPLAGLVNATGRRNVAGYFGTRSVGVDGEREIVPRRLLPRFPIIGIDFSTARRGHR